MTILVVGTTGFIGSQLFDAASKMGAAIGASRAGAAPTLALDLAQPELFDYEKIQAADTVLLTAAISSPDICAREHDRAWDTNVTGTGAFIERVMARGGRVIFFSSDTVYGEQSSAFDESAPCRPAGEYAEMKRAVEQRFLGNPLFKVVRLSYVFSRADKFTGYLAGCAARGEEADIFHPFYRAVVHRQDVIDGVLALAQRWEEFPGAVFNFGGPEALARTEFAHSLQQLALPALRYRVTEPGAEFFKNRPREIRMVSAILPMLLKRPARTLREAIEFEFNEEKEEQHV
jgi:dTDP-4-dehydrorhamnose reductase